MEVPNMLDGFLVSTAAGAGQGLGQILMTWLLQRWRKFSGTARPPMTVGLLPNVPLASDDAAAGDVAAADVATGGRPAVETAAGDGSPTSDDAADAAPPPPPELLRAVESPRSPADWTKVLEQLQRFGVDLPPSAAAELAALQQTTLDRVAAPTRVLGRLAELTAHAFERAGVEPADLQRWQRIEDCLASDPDLESAAHSAAASSAPYSAPVAVAPLTRPSTWFAWTREELDRRLTTYLRRTVRRCDQACELALRTSVDCELALLRELRNWRADLGVLEQFLSSLPPLHGKTRSLRPLSGRGKEATRALEEAALVATNLHTATTRLFQQPVGSTSWSQQLLACRQATAQLTQQVRERRDLRQ